MPLYYQRRDCAHNHLSGPLPDYPAFRMATALAGNARRRSCGIRYACRTWISAHHSRHSHTQRCDRTTRDGPVPGHWSDRNSSVVRNHDQWLLRRYGWRGLPERSRLEECFDDAWNSGCDDRFYERSAQLSAPRAVFRGWYNEAKCRRNLKRFSSLISVDNTPN